MRKLLNLVLIQQDGKVLLGMKKRGFGAGRWNGFGGKVAEGETIEQSARRELLEECGVEVSELDKRGILEFSWQGKEDTILEVHIFRGTVFSGEPTETEEMKPQWYAVDAIPFAEMWPADSFWVPLFLAGKKFKGKILFGEQDAVLEHQLQEVGVL